MSDNYSGKYVPLVLYPRFTTRVGEGPEFYTLPLDVSAYQAARITFWRGPILGTSPQLKFYLEQSSDRITWTTCEGISSSGFEISEDVEKVKTVTSITRRWMRAMAILSVGDACTIWAQGFLVKRET